MQLFQKVTNVHRIAVAFYSPLTGPCVQFRNPFMWRDAFVSTNHMLPIYLTSAFYKIIKKKCHTIWQIFEIVMIILFLIFFLTFLSTQRRRDVCRSGITCLDTRWTRWTFLFLGRTAHRAWPGHSPVTKAATGNTARSPSRKWRNWR